jgi:tetratricopeptide (TPR) repeat protein
MLVELAGYQGNQGRIDAARRMFEEAIEILALDKRTRPMDYFIALNNLAVLFIHVHDYMAAQHLLERALNLTLLARKTSAGDNVVVNAGQLPTMEFVLHMNLACIFIEFHELADAKRHLREASLLFDEVGKAFQKMFHDHFLCLRARWKLEAGRIDDAWKELERAHDLDFSNCVRMRAKLHVACNEYQDALVLLDQAFEQQRRKGSLHHPEMLEACLERATCQFELGKRSDALKSLDEARRIVTDFRLPRRDRWRKNLAPWAARAREIGDSELQRSLDAELQTIPETDAGIVVLERFRRVASDMDPNESEDR